MPQYNVTLKADAPPEALEKAKQDAQEKGGTITHEYSLIKGFMYGLHFPRRRSFVHPSWHYFAPQSPHSHLKSHSLICGLGSVEYPPDHVDTLESNDSIHVEEDGEVRTQE
ncbi:hypothetical protein N7466_007457 [Penicillium verhagenii]|uniref:uncharacterized protein n=1 Tax=Penicillium verhagenii TaxID=1562060 RepID=UPI002545529E|nr:uncharacterized protein N7466_007457 [Penicillium verhagenii]KAJ5928501.1 hypothetical protein N7466_007457 [Penicillium verhagenii]